MTLGAEPKKLAALGVLVFIGLPAAYHFASSGDAVPEAATKSKSGGPRIADRLKAADAAVATPPDLSRQAAARMAARARDRSSIADYKPSLKPRRPEDRPDPMTVDPTLKLTLISRLRDINVEGGRRSLFDFGAAPSPVAKQPEPGKIIPKTKFIGPEPPPKPVLLALNVASRVPSGFRRTK